MFYKTDNPNNTLTETRFLEYAHNFDYAYVRNNKNIFDFENSISFAEGNKAMNYAFDKYLILEDKETGVLTRVRYN